MINQFRESSNYLLFATTWKSEATMNKAIAHAQQSLAAYRNAKVLYDELEEQVKKAQKLYDDMERNAQ